MLEYDFLKVLRLDGCFRFLSLATRIHLHQSTVSAQYFLHLPHELQLELKIMAGVLTEMQWDVPSFHKLRENEDTERYWVYVNNNGAELSEADYAKMYKDKFEEFLKHKSRLLHALKTA